MAGGNRKKQNQRRPAQRRPAAQRAPAKPVSTAKPAAAAGTPPRKTQSQRLEDARHARARKSRNTRLVVAGVAGLVVGLIAFNSFVNRRDSNALRTRLTAGGCTFDHESDRTDASPNNHVPPNRYEVDPPAGGNHDPSAADAGTFTEENKPPDDRIVHSLEHGYVAIWHRPDLDEAGMAAIRQAAAGSEKDVLIVPRATLTGQLAATAWGERLLCPTVETGPLKEFIETYRNKGPERIPHPDI
ncbi:MAG: DUF3105 domain-containing protein [Acidimicrobiales bacterium]